MGVLVEVDVDVSVGVNVEVKVGVMVGVKVWVGVGVNVGPKTCPGPQADRINRKLSERASRIILRMVTFP